VHARAREGSSAVSEKVARVFGTPYYIVGQTIGVAIWIALNTVAVTLRWDPYPFILLYLAFSTQAAYAAPLILLAQTRQAHRDLTSAQAVKRRPADEPHIARASTPLGALRSPIAPLSAVSVSVRIWSSSAPEARMWAW